MTAKQYLRQLKDIDNLISVKLAERERILSLGTRLSPALTDVRVDSSPPQDKIGDVAIRLAELAEEINRQIDRLVDLKQEATDLIDEIEDFRLRTLLYQYYVLNNTLEQTAVNMDITFRWVQRQHKKALQVFETVFEGRKDVTRAKRFI